MSYESIGERLKKARQAKKITLEDAYSKTKIHTNILQALEENRFQEYSPVYIKGFLKIYAKFLGLDTEAILQELRDSSALKKPEPSVKEVPKKKIYLYWPRFKLNPVLIKNTLIALVIIVLIFSFVSCLKRIKAKAPKISEEPESQEIIPSAVVETKKAKFAKLSIRAKDKCWLQVKLDGKLFYRGTFTKGMSDTWQANEKIELSVGNAAAVELEINGRLISSLGRKGQAVKEILITRDGFSIGK
jgi:cytoskeletal protein RodZ